MDDKNDYKRINSGLYWRRGIDYEVIGDQIIASTDFMQRLEESNTFFNSCLLKPIIDKIGNDGWAVNFIQIFKKEFFADIYVDDVANVSIIQNVCEVYLSRDYNLHYYHRGKVFDYVNS